MPINFDDYLSTSVRWALFKADWPDASVEFSEGSAIDTGIPAAFSKKEERVCIATITRHADDNRPIIGYKTVSDAKVRDTDGWNTLCSKAMGRALKKAGYPDTMTDLKLLMRFREVNGKSSNDVATNAITDVSVKSNVAGQKIETPQLKIESKENPVKSKTDWRSDNEREEVHKLFKQMCSGLTPDELEALRDAHEKLNNRLWPMPKAELNAMIVNLEGIRSASKESSQMIETSVLVTMFNFLSENAKAIVIKSFGEISTWPESVTEKEYNKMMDVFETASEQE